jgi:ribosomal protein S12 methylthiotransferase accessory factor
MTAWHASLFTGLFTQFGPLPSRPHDPVCALFSGTTASWLPHHEVGTASGIGWDAAAAEGACIGEAIERLQCGPLPDDAIVRARYDDWSMPEPAVDPAKWVLFHADQYRQQGFPFQPLTHDTVGDWVCCRQALTGDPWWVPAEMVYLHQPAGHLFCPGVSTGLAAGRTGDPILLRGLQEVIERDAVLGAWWGRDPVEEHPFASVLQHLGDAPRFVRPNLTYRCYRVQSPFSEHVTMVTLEGDDREGYCFSIGSACRETRAASWGKSLLEAIHSRHYVRYLKNQVAAGSMKMDGLPTSFAEHAVYYSLRPDRLRATILHHCKPAGERNEPVGSEPASRLIERLGPARPVLFRSMTPPALATENLGWHVLRVVVPGLQPLHGHHAYPHLGGPNWSPRGLADWQTIPPHPFP